MLMGIINAIQKMKFVFLLLMCMVIVHLASLTKYKLKDKIIKNFKTASTEH